MAARSAPRSMRPTGGAFFMAALAAACSAALWLAPGQQSFVATAGARPLAGFIATQGLAKAQESAVARQSETAGRKWKGASRYPRYEGFVYRRKMPKGVRLRLARYGGTHWPFYRIHAAFQTMKQHRSGRFLEKIGYWDPMKELDDPRAFKIKADRAAYWLRMGAHPTDQVANLLDMVGIIRRTGPLAKRGEWEWRVDKNSGPEAPEGWSWDGPQPVTWGNKPLVYHRKGHPSSLQKTMQLPLIERYGFKGYTRIPMEGDVITDPLTKSTLLEAFPNTELPVYE